MPGKKPVASTLEITTRRAHPVDHQDHVVNDCSVTILARWDAEGRESSEIVVKSQSVPERSAGRAVLPDRLKIELVPFDYGVGEELPAHFVHLALGSCAVLFIETHLKVLTSAKRFNRLEAEPPQRLGYCLALGIVHCGLESDSYFGEEHAGPFLKVS